MSKPKTKWNGKTKYPWTKWFKTGAKLTLVSGKDYESPTHSFLSYLYQRATHYRVDVKFKVVTKGISIKVERGLKKSA